MVTGRGLLESPRWHDGRLYFSDWSAHEVLALGADGACDIVAQVESLPLCMDFRPDGRMLILSVVDELLLQLEPDGSLTTSADLAGVARGWNDIVVDGRGNAYLNGAGFNPMTGEPPAPGHVTLVTPDGVACKVGDGLSFPNGMAVTADNTTLIVAESYAKRLTAFDIAADGSLSNQRVWADLGDGVPDGICIDAENAVWFADVPNKRCSRVSEGGEVRQTVTLDRGGFACMLGGPERTTLFVVGAEWRGMKEMVAPGSGRVYATEVTVPGAGWP